jgi:hypothetical protein
MKPLRRIAILVIAMNLAGVTPATARAEEDKWAPDKAKESKFNGRKLDTFRHGTRKEWGYAEPRLKIDPNKKWPKGKGCAPCC